MRDSIHMSLLGVWDEDEQAVIFFPIWHRSHAEVNGLYSDAQL